MRIFLYLCRLVVGPLFIVSGLIKANDPLGFSYKLEEYFAESALNLPGLEPYALALAIAACMAEIVLGFAVLLGGRMRLATASLMLLTIFFGWLTAYTAMCDPQGTYTILVDGQEVTRGVTCVTDCGCFGDALKGSVGRSLTPWESFAKDAILFVFILPLFVVSFRRGIPWNRTPDDLVLLPLGLLLVAAWGWVFNWGFPVLFTAIGFAGYVLVKRWMKGPAAEWSAAGWVALISVVFIHQCIAHLPMRDYRPYAIGNNIRELREAGEPPVQRIFLRYRNKTTGEVSEYESTGTYPWDDDNFEFVDQRTVVIKPGIDPPIPDFNLTDIDGYDITEDILGADRPVLLITSYNVRHADKRCMPAITRLAGDALERGWYVYGVTASTYEAIEEFRHAHGLAAEFTQADEKVVKTIARSNPAVVLLQDAVVRGKWHCNDAPAFSEALSRIE
jgi:uncharacterized membrane protein YphA (DoxX/SURF4 family)